jgi:hypothetical protein
MRTLIFLALSCVLTHAASQVQRCVDERGRTTYSDIPCDRQGAIPTTNPNRSTAPPSTDMVRRRDAVLSMISAAGRETDPDRKRRVASEIEVAMAAYSAEMNGAAQGKAEMEAGVPELERQLQDARRTDRVDPLWKPGIGDSPVTRQIHEQLLKARESASMRVPHILRSDADFQRTQAAYSVFARQR